MTGPPCSSAPWTSGRCDPGSALQTDHLGSGYKHGQPGTQGFLYQSGLKNKTKQVIVLFSCREQQINWESSVWWSEMHLSESVAVSFSGCRDNYLLSPVLAVEVFQVFLDGLQPGQFSREVNGCNPRVAGVPVQLFFQSLVDLMQRAQEELKRRRRRRGGVTLAWKKVGTKWHHSFYYGCNIYLAYLTLYCCRVTCPFWKLSISSVFSALTWFSFVTFLICSERSLQDKNKLLSMHPAV